jgi:hypothetical protein
VLSAADENAQEAKPNGRKTNAKIIAICRQMPPQVRNAKPNSIWCHPEDHQAEDEAESGQPLALP